MPDTHSCPPLILRVHEHTHIWCAHLQPFQECFDNTHTQVAVYWRFGWWWHTHTHTYIHATLLAQTHISPSCLQDVSLARMWRYMQLAYLFHQYAKSLFSTDGRIADFTVRHPGVERPFSSCPHGTAASAHEHPLIMEQQASSHYMLEKLKFCQNKLLF